MFVEFHAKSQTVNAAAMLISKNRTLPITVLGDHMRITYIGSSAVNKLVVRLESEWMYSQLSLIWEAMGLSIKRGFQITEVESEWKVHPKKKETEHLLCSLNCCYRKLRTGLPIWAYIIQKPWQHHTQIRGTQISEVFQIRGTKIYWKSRDCGKC